MGGEVKVGDVSALAGSVRALRLDSYVVIALDVECDELFNTVMTLGPGEGLTVAALFSDRASIDRVYQGLVAAWEDIEHDEGTHGQTLAHLPEHERQDDPDQRATA